MKYWTTKNCRILHLMGKRSNMYLIETPQKKIMVDTQVEKNYTALLYRLENIFREIPKIDFLVLTHTHYDHTQNAARIKADTGAKVIVHRSEAAYLKSGFTPLPEGTLAPTKVVSKLGNKFFSKLGEYAAVIPDIEIDQEYIIENAPLLKIIHTPGHSEGSVSLLVENEYALSGDTVFNIWRGRVFPPFADDVPALLNSWKKLLDSGCHTFLPGHGVPATRLQLEREYFKKISDLS